MSRPSTTRRAVVSIALILAVGGGTAAYFKRADSAKTPAVTQQTLSRGDVIEVVNSTGTLQPVRTVNIGTQVSGVVQKLYVDFNSIVKKGQVIAELDPSLMKQQVDLAEAALEEAKTNLQGAQNVLDTDTVTADRVSTLFEHGLDTAQDRDAAVLARRQDEATVIQDRAAVEVAQSNLDQAKVNLAYCTITSPVDGVVVERDVDEGQAVAARVSAPTLYILATDLTTLELLGNIDEADVAKIRPGQDVSFRVDAYPDTFHGTVTSVRLNATVTSNVVTYQTVITVPNPDLRLKPSMTANIRFETGRAPGVLRVPNAALKFHPTAAMFDAFHQPMPEAISLALSTTCGGAECVQESATAPARVEQPGSTIDKDFPVPPKAIFPGQVWMLDGQQHLTRVPVRTGMTDGTWTELVSGSVQDGQSVVTAVTLPNTPAQTGASSLLAGRGPGGFGPGGGGARGR